MIILRISFALSVLLLASCSSSMPTPADMQRYYEAAEQQTQRDIDRLAVLRSRGEISPEEYQRREAIIKNSIPQRANQMAWVRHELTESELRGMHIPTAGFPEQIDAPGRGSSGTNSFYRQPGQTGSGYQGVGAGRENAYQPESLTRFSSILN